MDLHRTLDKISFPMDNQFSFEKNFKWMINCLVTWANMNEPSMQRTNWCYHCSVMYVTQQWTSSHENLSFKMIVPARMRENGNFNDASLEQLHLVSISINHVMSLSNAVHLDFSL